MIVRLGDVGQDVHLVYDFGYNAPGYAVLACIVLPLLGQFFPAHPGAARCACRDAERILAASHIQLTAAMQGARLGIDPGVPLCRSRVGRWSLTRSYSSSY